MTTRYPQQTRGWSSFRPRRAILQNRPDDLQNHPTMFGRNNAYPQIMFWNQNRHLLSIDIY
jgi:hypothetical protein